MITESMNKQIAELKKLISDLEEKKAKLEK